MAASQYLIFHAFVFSTRSKLVLLPVPKYGLDVGGQFAIPTLQPLGLGSKQRLFRPADTRANP